jgi:uncharacterized alkaline shock family protein YloU
MTDELRLEGIGVSPGVLDTIVTMAAGSVEDVAVVQAGGLAGFVKGAAKRGPAVTIDENGAMTATVHVTLRYGRPLHVVAAQVQQAVAEALASQTGQPVTAVDVFVDALVFDE